MPTNVALTVLHDLAARGIHIVRFCGGGEPLLHPNVGEVLRCAHDLGLEIHLTTNGVRLARGTLDTVAEVCAVVKVSANAGSALTYAKIHGRDHWARVWGNLQVLRELRGSASSPRLEVSCVVTSANVEGAAALVALARSAGADEVRFTTDTFEGGRGGSELLAVVRAELAESGWPTGIEVRLIASEPDDLVDTDLPCPLALLTCVVGADGSVFPSCHHANYPAHALGVVTPTHSLGCVLDDALPTMRRYCLGRGQKMRKLVSSPANLALLQALVADPAGAKALRSAWAQAGAPVDDPA